MSSISSFSMSWLLVCVCALVATAAQKPVRQVEVFTDGGFEVPETIDELWEQSAVVVEGHVVDVRPANETLTPPKTSIPWWAASADRPVTMVRTDYVIQVQRVLKSDDVVRPGTATVIVRRIGGTVDSGEYIAEYFESRFPQKFTLQGRYALFLKATKAKPAPEPVYFPAVGADSAFEIVGDRVVPLGRTAASRQLGRLSVEQFVATLAKKSGQ